MRFVTYAPESAAEPGAARPPAPGRAGVLVDQAVHGLPVGVSLLSLLGDDGERLHQAGVEASRDPREVVDLAAVRLLAPLPAPPTIRDFMTFRSHIEPAWVTRAGAIPDVWFEQPVFYFTNPYAVTGPHDDVPVPPACARFDLEAEVAAVIGTAGRDLTPDQAQAAIVGYTVLNDWSARDLQAREREIGLGPVKGKDTSTTMGPALVTADELQPYRSGTSFDLGISATINGERLGGDRLDSMEWSFGEMGAFASRGTWLRPGDVLGSGTCGGGCLFELWAREGPGARAALCPGDVVEVTVEHLGSVRNTVVAGAEPVPLRPRARRHAQTSHPVR